MPKSAQFLRGIHLRARQRICDREMAVGRGHVVVDRGKGPVGRRDVPQHAAR